MDEILAGLAVIIGGLVAIFLAVILCMMLWAGTIGPQSCEAFAAGMKLETEYKFWYGCFITMPDGERLPESIARKVLEQRYKLEVKE